MKKYLPLFSSFLLALTVVGAYVFLLSQIDTYVTRIGVAISQTEAFNKKETALQATQVFLNETSDLRGELAETVIGSNDVVEVIQLLERTARENKLTVTISNVAVGDVGDWKYHEQVQATFSLEGSFANLITFLGTVEQLPVAVRIEQVNLEKSGTRTWYGTFMMTVVKEKS